MNEFEKLYEQVVNKFRSPFREGKPSFPIGSVVQITGQDFDEALVVGVDGDDIDVVELGDGYTVNRNDLNTYSPSQTQPRTRPEGISENELSLPDVDNTIGTDADGTAIEQGHIVTYNGAQYVVNGPAVAGPDDEAMVDIIQLGKDITVPANQLTVSSELGG